MRRTWNQHRLPPRRPLPSRVHRLHRGAAGENDGVTASYGFTGLLADVLVHSVTKSPDYVYRRARPRFPVVRFLADTEENANAEGHYPFQATTLDWGDESATWPAPPGLRPGQRGRLLSPCAPLRTPKGRAFVAPPSRISCNLPPTMSNGRR